MSKTELRILRAEVAEEIKVKTPFVTVQFKGTTLKTKSLSNATPPFEFNEILTFQTAGVSADIFKINLYDDDGFMGTNKLIGSANSSYGNLKSSGEKTLTVSNKKGTPVSGTQIVVEFVKKENKQDSSDGNQDEGFQDSKDGGEAPGVGATGTARTDRSSLSEKAEDFQIRVRIICGRQLTGSNIKPVVKVKAGKSARKVTRIRKGSAPEWNELMMFPFNMSLKEFYNVLFEFEVCNSKKLRSDSLIGSFKLDVGSIYDQPGHAYVKKWILLTDPDDASATAKGYLKMTICVLGAGDQPPDEKGESDDEDVEGNLLTPAGAALRSATFSLRVFRGKDFPQMDSSAFSSMKNFMGFGNKEDTSAKLCDPYLSFYFAGKKRKTHVIEGTNEPKWNDQLQIPFKFPSMCDTLRLTVKDWDRVGSDDPIGSKIISLSRISSTGEESTSADVDEEDFEGFGGYLPTFGPTFINLYGSPREFTTVGDNLEELNTGKGEGCAYRGRIMVELKTQLDGEDQPQLPDSIPIDENTIASINKYTKRRRYRLVVAFESAGMLDKKYENVQFEISMGNFTNKTESKDALFDGNQYHFIPWTDKKPVLLLTSCWEDIGFRLNTMNYILRLADRVENEVNEIKEMIKGQTATDMEIASEIIDTLDMIISETTKRLRDPHGQGMSNSLDSRIYQDRLQTFLMIHTEAKELRQSCTDADEAVAAIVDYLERLKTISFEPQNSIPDIIIWMIAAGDRKAYIRIPANEILHSVEKKEYSGRSCGKPMDMFLKYPTANPSSKKHSKIPCRLRIMAWLGRTFEQHDFRLEGRGKISVVANTYEMQRKSVMSWSSDGFTDITGEIPLPKESFTCPEGWQWDGEWEISKDLAMLHGSASYTITEELYEVENRFPQCPWQPYKILNVKNKEIKSRDEIKCSKGWNWEADWSVDMSRECDAEGWDYTADSFEDGGQMAWISQEKGYHLFRRKRILRKRVFTDEKALRKDEKTETKIGEGWEYSSSTGGEFHVIPKILDRVRRRHWIRKMVSASEEEGSSGIFNLDQRVGEESPPPTPWQPTPVVQVEEQVQVVDIVEEEVTTEKDVVLHEQQTTDIAPVVEEDMQPSLPAPAVSTDDSVSTSSVASKSTTITDVSKTPQKTSKPKVKKDLELKGPATPIPHIVLEYEDPVKLHFRGYLYQARDLLPMDHDSFSDPLVIVTFLNCSRRTQTVKHTLNPVWDQSLMMDTTFFGDLSHLKYFCPRIMIEVFDRDEVGDIEFMGRTTGTPTLLFGASEDETRCQLSWHNVMKGTKFGGSILAGFELFLKKDEDEMPLAPPKRNKVFMVPYGIRPVLQRTALEFLVWGVRNMESFQLLSVDSPSVLVQIGDVEIRTKIIKKIKKNPNFSSPVYFVTANLPENQLYFPPIIIRVKDNRKFGRRPTVGQHIISNIKKYTIQPPVEECDSISDEGFSDDEFHHENNVQDTAIEVENTAALLTKKKSFFGSVGGMFKSSAPPVIREDEIDWWSKFYASVGEGDGNESYYESGLDLVKIYKGELEKQEDFKYFSDFLETFRLFRGKAENEDDEPEFAGEFKGSLRIYSLPADTTAPMPPRFFQNLPSTEPVEVSLIIYIVRAFDLAPQDDNGLSDPYIKIKVGKKKRVNDRKSYIPNTLEPTFGKVYQVTAMLPMEKDLTIQVIDWDLIGSDDKIGETVIDIENRYLSKYKAWCGLPESYYTSGPFTWRDQKTPKELLLIRVAEKKWDDPVWNGNTSVLIHHKTYNLADFEKDKAPSPYWGAAEERLSLYVLRAVFDHVDEHVETRPLYSHIMPNIEQGRIQMWVDIFPKELGEPQDPFIIEPRKPSKYYVRVIIWNCSDIPFMDTSFTGDQMSDIYFKGWISGLESKRQKTDVHYRSLDGTGMFNWRFVFPFEYLPQERLVHVSKKEHIWSLDKTVTKFPPVLNIQVWDNDLFGPNEYISEVTLPLTKMPKCCKFRKMCKLENVPDLQGNCKMDIVSLFDQKLLKGWWPLYRTVKGEREQAGKVEMSVEIVTFDEQEEKPAGQGRDEPNMNPHLDKPKRPATSFAWFSSPFKSLRYIIWRKYKWYIIGALIFLLLAAFIVLFIYNVPEQLSRKLIL